MTSPEPLLDICYALVCLRTGALLEHAEAGPLIERMKNFASAAPEVFRASTSYDFGPLFARLGSDRSADAFQEVVFVSGQCAHVAQRMRHRPEVALVAVSTDVEKLGLMLSGVRARALVLEASP